MAIKQILDVKSLFALQLWYDIISQRYSPHRIANYNNKQWFGHCLIFLGSLQHGLSSYKPQQLTNQITGF